MRKLHSLTRSLFISLTMFAFSFALFLATPQSARAQSEILKKAKAQKEAGTIKRYTDLLVNFYDFVSRAKNGEKTAAAELPAKAKKLIDGFRDYKFNIEDLLKKLGDSPMTHDQIDADADKLLGGNVIASSRAFQNGGVLSTLNRGLDVKLGTKLLIDVSIASERFESHSSGTEKAVCRYLAVGIIAEALLLNKGATSVDKLYIKRSCSTLVDQEI
jgi:hypothetical protein